jgi:hypothetical protein
MTCGMLGYVPVLDINVFLMGINVCLRVREVGVRKLPGRHLHVAKNNMQIPDTHTLADAHAHAVSDHQGA